MRLDTGLSPQQDGIAQSPRCPLCGAEGHFNKAFGQHRLFKCSDCRSLFYWPPPILAFDAPGPWWESTKWYVERVAHLLFYREILEYTRLVLLAQKGQMGPDQVDFLEVGGSYGFLLDMAKCQLGWRVQGVDPSLCARDGARELGLDIINGRLEDGGLTRCADALVGIQLIEHLADPRAFARAMAGALKDDGFMVLTTPDALLEDLGPEYCPGEHNIMFSPEGLEIILAEAGFQHRHFVKPHLHSALLVLASKKKLSVDLDSAFKAVEVSAVKGMVQDYLETRLRSGPLSQPLDVGLHFRLFELLVNDGRYDQALRVAAPLERLLGKEPEASFSAFRSRQVQALLAATEPCQYLEAGPGCFAPYLFYQGILSLNHHGNTRDAAECFYQAAQLFDYEVHHLGLEQYEPWLTVAQKHAAMAGKPIRLEGPATEKLTAAPMQTETRHLLAPPFISRGIADLQREIPVGRLRLVKAEGHTSYISSFKSWEDHLSGVVLDLRVVCYPVPGTVELSLFIFEEFNPIPLRTASQKVDVSSQAARRFTEAFQFAPLFGSQGKTYTIVLECSANTSKAFLLCASVPGGVTIAGSRRHKNTQSVIIPYHSMEVPGQRYSQHDAPLISCLIVTYNSAGYIRRCLDSLLRQNYPNLEIIVVDNQSQDQTVEIVREEFPSVKLLIADRNLEFAKGMNWGCSQCQGEYICVLNCDLVLEDGAIRRFVEHLEISPFIAIVGSVIETKGSIIRYADTFLLNGRIGSSADFLQGTRFCAAPCGAGFLIRKSVIDKMGYLFDAGFISNWEDHDLGLRCWLQGYLVLHISETGLYHDGGGAYGFLNPKRDPLIIRNTLLTYFKSFGWGNFLRAFVTTALTCTTLRRIWGLFRFLGSFWKYLPVRAALQRQRQISDTWLSILTSGIVGLKIDQKK